MPPSQVHFRAYLEDFRQELAATAAGQQQRSASGARGAPDDVGDAQDGSPASDDFTAYTTPASSQNFPSPQSQAQVQLQQQLQAQPQQQCVYQHPSLAFEVSVPAAPAVVSSPVVVVAEPAGN